MNETFKYETTENRNLYQNIHSPDRMTEFEKF